MKQYKKLLQEVLNSPLREIRDGGQTLSSFGTQSRYALARGFPLVTTKRVHFKSVVHELLWFLSGSTNISYLKDNGVSIWNEWADEKGELGPVYGKQWRNFGGIDQINQVIEQIKSNPMSRRLIVSAWNPSEISKMALPPCHVLFQFYVNDGFLSCQLYQRSADLFLGVPFNIASYALLIHMIAHVCGLKVGEFVHTIGDAHIYTNHVSQVSEQLKRECRPLPTISLNTAISNIFDFTYKDIELINYKPWPRIKAKVFI